MDFKPYVIHGKTYYSAKNVYETLEQQEGKKVLNIWLGAMIRKGRVPSYRFSKVYLLDEKGVDMVLALRQVVNAGLRIRSGAVYQGYEIEDGKYTTQQIENVYTEKDLMAIDGIGRSDILNVRAIYPQCVMQIDSTWMYLPCAIRRAKLFPDTRKMPRMPKASRPIREDERIGLAPLTRLEKYAIQLRDVEGLSFTEIAQRAVDEGVGQSKSGRSNWQNTYRRATIKLALYEQREGMGRDEVLRLENQREKLKEERDRQKQEGQDGE